MKTKTKKTVTGAIRALTNCKIKRISILLFTFIFLNLGALAQVQVGYGSATNQSLPIEPYYGYSYSQVIYLASEINASGDITELQWYFDGSSLGNSNDWTIYIGHTSKTEFTSTGDWIPVGSMTLVYSGTFTDPGTSGWITFDITDWTYNGTDNIVVAVDENAPGYDGSDDEFYCTSVTDNRGIEYHNDNNNPNPASPPTATNLRAYIANIIFGGITQSCPPPSAQAESNITSTSADLDWTTGGASTWDIEWGPAGFTQGSGTMVTGITSKPYTLSGLTAYTTYDWYVRDDCGGGDQSFWTGPSTFTTACVALSVPWYESFEGMSSVGNGILPDCMAEDGGWTTADISQSYNRDARIGNHYIYTSYSADDWLFSPPIDLTAGTSYDFSFWYVTDGLPGWTTVEAKYGTGQTAGDMTTTIGYPVSGANNTTYVEYRGSFTPATSGTYYMGIHVVATSSPWYITFDDLRCEETPTCPMPTTQEVTNITSSSADLDWTSGGASTWDIEWGPAGFTQGSGTMETGITSKPYTLSGLSDNTIYDWYVRDDCGGGDQSAWMGPNTFTTPCNAFTAPFSEDFDGVTAPDIPSCWSSLAVTSSSYAYVETYIYDSPNSSPNHVRFYNAGDASATLLLITPQLSDLTSQANQIRFFAKHGSNSSDLIVGTMSDPADETTFTAFTTISLTGTYQEYTVLFDASYTGTDEYIAFKHGGSTTYLSVYVDDFVYEPIPSCPAPTAQTESNITTTTADLDWTTGGASTWDIEWGPAGFTQGSGTMVTGITGKPYTLTGLSANTDYDWYVRDDCGGGDMSLWTGPATFTTACNPFTATFSENFDGVTAPAIPNCWSTIVTSSDANANVITTTSSYPQSTPNHVFMSNFNDAGATLLLITPQLSDLTSQANQIRFYAKRGLAGVDLIVGTMSDPADESTFTIFTTVTITNVYTEYRVVFDASYTGTDEYIAFKHGQGGTTLSIFIDDFVYEPIPSCPAPTAQTVSNITTTSADLDWTTGGASTWDIEWGPSGFTQGSGTMVTGITSKPYTLSGLSPNTTYDWYVRDDCGGGDQSAWTGPATFTTECTVLSVPWNEGFEGMASVGLGIVPGCMAADGDWTTSDTPAYDYNMMPRTGTNYIYTKYNADDWLFSPPLDLTGGTSYTFSFWYVTDGLSGWTTVEAKYGTGQTSGDMTLAIGTPVSGPTNTSYVEYRGTFTPASSGTFYVAIHVVATYAPWAITFDDLSVYLTPSCPSPMAQSASNITTTSVDLDWTTGGASTWDIEWGPTGFTQGSGTMVTGITGKPYTLSGLSSGTTYDWYVRDDCGGGDQSTWTGPHTFSTACDATTVPYIENFDNVTAPGFPLCLTIEDANSDDITWETNSSTFMSSPNAAQITYNDSETMDDWFFTQGLQLTGGTTYDVTFVYAAESSSYPERLAVDWGNTAAAASMSGSPIFDNNNIDNEDFLAGTGSFTPTVTGTYYVGFHGYSSADQYNLYVDDVKVMEQISATTWSGAVDNDWDTPGNWSGGVPSSATDVTIPTGLTNYPTLNSGTVIGSLTVESDATGDASILNDDMLFMSGNTTVQRYLTGGVWHDFSASTQNQTLNSVYFNHNPDVWLRTYNEPDNSHTYLTNLSDPMYPGAGFEIWVENGYNVTVNFTGALQTGDVTLTTSTTPTLSYSGPDPLGYNLIGNPFASPIDLDLGNWNLTNVSTSFWVWNPSSGTYYDWNTSGGGSGSLTNGIVPMGQGFFVQATGASPSLTIPVAARVHSSQSYYKFSPAEDDGDGLPRMSLRALTDNGYDEMNITFSEEATEEFDNYDTRKIFAFEGNTPQVYSVQYGEQLSINGLPLLTGDGYEVKVAYRSGTDGTQWLEANLENLPETEVLLEDYVTGDVQSLADDPLYKFEAHVDNEPVRFVLHFNPVYTGVEDQPEKPEIRVYAFDGAVYIQSKGEAAKEKKQVVIYDLFGRTVLKTTVCPSTLNRIPVNRNDAFLIVKTVNPSGVTATKLLIK